MIKLLAGAVLMLVSFYIGVQVERYYKKRLEIFREFYDFLQYAAREINFFKTDIISITKNFIKDKNTSFSKSLDEIKDSIEKGEQLKLENPILKPQEKSFILRFFEGISKSDYNEQAKLFDRYKDEANVKVRLSEKQKKEKGELFKKLLILGGVALMILLI